MTVSRSDGPGLFACYDVAGVPRTNNDLERAFGSHRYHKRRATGRKGAGATWRGQAGGRVGSREHSSSFKALERL